MTIGPVTGGTPAPTASAPQSPQNPRSTEELTTITTHCKERHRHDESCPHTVSTRPAPKIGEPGYRLDEKV